MMGKRMPETCWAVFERRAINLRDWCIWLVDLFECMMMHGPMNIKCRVIFNKPENCASSWFYCRNISRCTVLWTSQYILQTSGTITSKRRRFILKKTWIISDAAVRNLGFRYCFRRRQTNSLHCLVYDNILTLQFVGYPSRVCTDVPFSRTYRPVVQWLALYMVR